jgi:hypothetical protein
MNRVTVRSYRIVDQVPGQARQRLLRCAPFAERTQCYTDLVKIEIGRDPGGETGSAIELGLGLITSNI